MLAVDLSRQSILNGRAHPSLARDGAVVRPAQPDAGERSSRLISACRDRESTGVLHSPREAFSAYQASLWQCGTRRETPASDGPNSGSCEFAQQTDIEGIDDSIVPVGCLLKLPGDAELSPRTAQPSSPGHSYLG